MNRVKQFQACMDLARLIVEHYRSEAPEGFDPKNTWVAIGVGVAGAAVSAGTSAYGASQSKKANQQMLGSIGKPPGYQPINFDELNHDAINTDRKAYQLSDKDFASRHPLMLDAEHRFENQTAKDQTGNTELMPSLQNEFMRSGIAGSLDSFGDAGATLAPGSAGEASVARNLGTSIMGFQQMNRGNRQQSLSLAEQLFPRRTFGLTGKDQASIAIGNNGAQNASNQNNYANGVQVAQLENASKQQSIAQNMAIMSALTSSLTSAGGTYAGAKSVAGAGAGTTIGQQSWNTGGTGGGAGAYATPDFL